MIPFFFFGLFDSSSEVVPEDELLTDTHDGFWRKQWEKKKKKPIVVEELAEFIEQVATKEIAKPKVIADTRLFELYRQSIEINQHIAEKLERIYQAELDDEDEAILMLLGVY